MTEIRVDVDLEQPPPVVWRALTEAHLVTDWLPASRFMVRDDGTFTFHATDLAGLEDPIEGRLVAVEAPHRLVMRWEGENLHTVVTIAVAERERGSRLTLTQSGFLGPQGTMRRRVLLTTYTSLLEGSLTATLAKIAARAAEEPSAPPPPEPPATPRRNDGGPFNRLPRQSNAPSQSSAPSHSAPGLSSHTRSIAGPRPTTAVPGFAAAVLGAQAKGVAKVGPPATAVEPDAVGTKAPNAAQKGWRWLVGVRDWSADRRSQAVAAGAAILLLLAMAGILVGQATALHPAKPPQTGGDSPGPTQAAVPAASDPVSRSAQSAAQATPRSTQTPATTAPSTGTTTPPPSTLVEYAQLTAAYRTEDLSLTAYRVTVTISNPGRTTANDWTLVIALPLLDLGVRNVTGAVMTRTDVRVVFTPVDATRTVKPGGSATVRFDVEGLGVRNGPFTCTIDGRPCTAIPG
ncbi:SRPBCC domain-containing protein [Dactylosporangium sp. CA-092794]|uniref:SRPBCC domain-containing protein n=1 Tax=Dactylosporangium sp. CA-092794 TaxID=3239929 RepID=UPI003D916AB0